MENNVISCIECMHKDWKLVWLSEDLEGYECKNCGHQEVDIDMPKYEVLDTHWDVGGPLLEIQWVVKDVGFGTITFVIDENGDLALDIENMDKEFVKAIFDHLIENNTKFVS